MRPGLRVWGWLAAISAVAANLGCYGSMVESSEKHCEDEETCATSNVWSFISVQWQALKYSELAAFSHNVKNGQEESPGAKNAQTAKNCQESRKVIWSGSSFAVT